MNRNAEIQAHAARDLRTLHTRLGHPDRAHLFLELLDADINRLAGLDICPQTTDPGFCQLVRFRDQTLCQTLTTLAQQIPATRIATHLRVSLHWVEAALLAYELPATPTTPNTQPLPSETAWLSMTHAQRLDKATAALGWPYAHRPAVVAATELGISLELFERLRLKRDDKPTPPAPNPHREKRVKITPDQYQYVCDRLDKAGSIQNLATQTGQPYWYVHRLARKAGWPGIRFQDKEPVAAKIQRLFDWLDDHLDAKPMTLAGWMPVIQGAEREVFTIADKRVCRVVLRSAGLERRRVDGRVVWGKKHWFRA